MRRPLFWCGAACFTLVASLCGQQTDQETIKQLTERLAESERRIAALEQKLGVTSAASASEPAVGSASAAATQQANVVPASDSSAEVDGKIAQAQAEARNQDMGGHNMELPGGGPTLNIRGFFDFNFGTGSIANPLDFPVYNNGCTPCGNPLTLPHTAFQSGEFDLFMTSRLSDHLSFLAEVVFGADTTNAYSIDIERYQLTYRLNDYFALTGGRFHTAIGYYNTAYHHGTWFSTAEGRPIMYLFEDSGGNLPVHTVGASATGLVPQTGKLGLHWIAEVGNGRSSNPAVFDPVQNFISDRNHKAFNLAAYIRPEWAQGLQIGGSYYRDRLYPPGFSGDSEYIASAYIVYITPTWEFLNEAVMLSDHMVGTPITFNNPMAYTQLSRKFGIYRPYFRYQYVNDRLGDPASIITGLYYGPSVGLRMDLSEYAAFKLQYNRLERDLLLPAENGLNAQIAFTF
jgi:hypothetical protein